MGSWELMMETITKAARKPTTMFSAQIGKLSRSKLTATNGPTAIEFPLG